MQHQHQRTEGEEIRHVPPIVKLKILNEICYKYLFEENRHTRIIQFLIYVPT
jgi:hypothetical protein